jgi:hypothetical protein
MSTAFWIALASAKPRSISAHAEGLALPLEAPFRHRAPQLLGQRHRVVA